MDENTLDHLLSGSEAELGVSVQLHPVSSLELSRVASLSLQGCPDVFQLTDRTTCSGTTASPPPERGDEALGHRFGVGALHSRRLSERRRAGPLVNADGARA